MEKVVLRHHDLYRSLSDQTKAMCLIQAFRGHYNTELLFEETLAMVNPRLIRTQDPHRDYEDGTDAKCLGILTRYQEIKGVRRMVIRGAVTGVSKKVSWIRLGVYNDFKKDIDYFLIPNEHGCRIRFHNGSGRIQFQYSAKKDSYSNGLNDYRVPGIEEVSADIVPTEKEDIHHEPID